MLDFATIANTTGSFPNVTSNNVSVPGAADGTPLVKNWVDQMFGAFQALLNEAGLTPNAVSESSSNSQIVDSIKRIASHPGEIMIWLGQETDPSVLGIRALALQGQGILRANYADLDTAIYCGNTDNPTADSCYRATDAAGTSRSTSGSYLILPDMRGRFLRGAEDTVLDFAGSRIAGNYQLSNVRKHYHDIKSNFGGVGEAYTWLTPLNYQAGGSTIDVHSTSSVQYANSLDAVNLNNNGPASATSEDNVPYNMAVHFWVRY